MSNFSTKIASTASVVALVATAMSASLVSAASEFLPYAELLADNSVIGVQSNESGYRLGDTVTRAELAKITANLGGYTATECAGTTYGDVGASLGDLCGYIESLAEAGVVSTANANFRPNASVTRAEAVKMLLGAVGETGSAEDAGYTDLANLGDLAAYVNRANELGCAADATFFRPNATSSRGEAFKIAACVAGLEVDTTTPVVPPVNGSGVTTPTVAGALTVALDGTAVAQYVPKNASSVKVGAVKLTAGKSDVTVQSLIVSRSGLGDAKGFADSNAIRAAQNGVVISSTADYYNATSQKATIYFSPALVVKAGSSASVDVLVNLSGSENSQHQFTLDAVNASNTTVTGAPVTLGLVNTTSYKTATTNANLAVGGSTITTGKANQLFSKVEISAGDRETKVTGFTLTRSGSTDFTKRLTNVKVYKNGVSVGTVTLTSEKLSVTGLADVLSSGNTQTYELRGDILVDATSTTLGMKIDSSTDVNAVEVATGYSTQVSVPADNTVGRFVNIDFGAVEFTFTKSSTGNVTLAPGTNNVKFFDGKLSSTTPVSVRKLTVSTPFVGTGITAFVNDQLTVKLNGSEIGTLTSLAGVQTLTVSFVVDSANPAVITIEGSTKNNVNISSSAFQFTVTLTEVRDSSNNSITNLGAGKNLIGDKTTINTSEVEIKTATIAAPSTSRIYSSAEQEIGRFALTSRNEVARLQSVVLTGTVVGGTIQAIANSTSSAKLVDVATGLEVSSTVTISNNTITFASMNDNIGKDVTKNYKVMLGVSSVDTYYGMTVSLGTLGSNAVSVVRDSNSNTIIASGNANTKTYTVGTVAPTVLVTAINENTFKVRVTNPDTNTGITLSGAKFDFKTALPGNTTYQAQACLRDLGNTETCGGLGTSGSGAVPKLGELLSVSGLTTNKTADKNGGYVEFEVYVTSANLLPTGGQLQVALTQLQYTVAGAADSETYVGTTGASASFTK
ncbi:S-layer homology domain-containing protein [Candidatus Gracilibacteria bacterium]|nr:S-layer homology domain-containing protein [Candidatus Gracilibacteria bacterium]